MVLRCCLLLLAIINISASYDVDYNFDSLIFSQRWPITACTEWINSKPSNKCTLPPKENLWTIHGIWPTKFGTKGPNFCNSSWHFDINQLNPILPNLELYWANIEANTPLQSLWKHEWLKHGTCAATLPEFDSQLNFFRKGLEWIQEYNMPNILSENGIIPKQTGYTVEDIYNAIKKSLNKNPMIECIIDKHTKLSLISEVRLCFDMNLTLTDCDLIKGNYRRMHDEILTNCDLKKSVMYLNKVPTYETYIKDDYDYMDRLYRLYNLVTYIMWFTM